MEMMKSGAYLINVARGGIVDEEALDWALTSGHLAGAALDCMAKEPAPAEYPLFHHKNLIATPHMAWYSEEAAQELKRKIAEEAVRFARGRKNPLSGHIRKSPVLETTRLSDSKKRI